MYKPPYFNEDRPEKLYEVMRDNPFATLISVSEGKPTVSHLPFLLETGERSHGRLFSHMAKANSHWQVFERNPEVTIVFYGPHAYISPAWYPPSPTNVPTWNYVVVHASGTARLITESGRAWEVMTWLVESNEKKYGRGWTPDAATLDAKMAGIVVFEVEIESLDGKFKLSQQQSTLVREKAARELLGSPIEAAREIGRLMLEGEKIGLSDKKRFGEFTLSTDRSLIQIDTVHAFLRRSHWARNRTRETVVKSIETSLCYGVYHGSRQVGFARIVTDYCTFAYLCDVFIDEAYRGRGLSKWMMECIIVDSSLKGLRRFLLATKDAHGLYARYGFEPLSEDERERLMGIRNDEV